MREGIGRRVYNIYREETLSEVMGFRFLEGDIRTLALVLAILGLLLLFFMLEAKYPKMSPVEVKGAKEGARVFCVGIAKSVKAYDWGASFSLCDGVGCVSVSAEKKAYLGSVILGGETLKVWGDVEKYYGQSRVRAEKIERG